MDEQFTDPWQLINISHAERDGVLVTTVTGEVDHDSAGAIGAELTARLDQRPTALVVDLEAVEFFGSMGVTTLLDARRRAESRGVGFAVVASRRRVLRTLQVTDVVEVLRVRGTLCEALALATRPAGTGEGARDARFR